MPLPRPTWQPNQSEKEADNLPLPTNPEDFRPSDVFRFEPMPDITNAELAYFISLFWTLDLNFDVFFGLEKDLQRHFQPIKIDKNR